jgi:hypothetical protein
MSTKNPKRIGMAVVLAVVFIQVALTAQTSRVSRPPPKPVPMSVPYDWSHRHLIFSAPSSVKSARTLQRDPRYWNQYLRRYAAVAQNRRNKVPPVVVPPDKGIHQDWGMSMGASGRSGAEMYPAKFSFDVNAAPDCVNDYVVFNTSRAGSTTKPSIIAFNQLYSTQGVVGGLCNRNGPSVMWSYNTNPAGDTTGTTVTSPVLPLNGTRVAYVETRTNAAGGAMLHILKWKAGQGTSAAPVAPNQIITDWSTCGAGKSCIVNITFNGAQPDTNSAPFYDYNLDVLYVGDDTGVLHKFTPIETGVPAEVVDGFWPITVNAGAVLSGPVFDAGSGNIFVGDSTGVLSYVQDVNSQVGACAVGVAPCLGTPSQALGGAIVDAPLVDSAVGTVFAFDGTDANHGSVYQFNTALTAASTVNVGGNLAGSKIHAGAFDEAYINSVDGTGYLYVCGKDATFNDRPAIHRISVTAGVMNTVSDGKLTLVNASGEECSPVSQIYNATTGAEWLFFSVGKSANQTGSGCSNTTGISGCLMALNLTTLAAWPPTAVDKGYKVASSAANGASTSGIVVDNVADTTLYPQASSIYFTIVSNSVTGATCNGTTGVGCAIKLTQSGLQ